MKMNTYHTLNNEDKARFDAIRNEFLTKWEAACGPYCLDPNKIVKVLEQLEQILKNSKN